MITQANGKVDTSICTFATTTAALVALGDWLASLEVSHVAMESKGVFWRPIYTVLEDQFELILANAHEIKALPGRKTDVRDCEWIAERYAAWLDPSQFHSRQARTGAAGSDVLSQKSGLSAYPANQSVTTSVLETATIKLTSVVSDVWGKSGQSMIKAIMQGESDAQTLTELARGSLRGKLPQLQQALEGRIQPHHRVLLQQIFAQLQFLETSMRASPPGDRSADGALSSGSGALADASRRT